MANAVLCRIYSTGKLIRGTLALELEEGTRWGEVPRLIRGTLALEEGTR